MPPGETRCWILVAACDGAEVIGISTRPAATTHARRRAQILKKEVLKAAVREVSEKSCNESRTLLLAFRRGVLDQIAGHRTFLVEPFLRGGADLFGGDGANAIRPASDILDAEAGGERPAIPARQRCLVVLGVDGFCDQLGLDAFEIFGANRVFARCRRSRWSITCSTCAKSTPGFGEAEIVNCVGSSEVPW